MKLTIAMMALVMVSSAHANRRPVEPPKEIPKTAADQRAAERERKGIEATGAAASGKVSEGQKVVANMVEAGKQVEGWKDAEGNADRAAQDNFMDFTAKLSKTPDELKADVAVEMIAERQGLKADELTPEKRAEILKELITCK